MGKCKVCGRKIDSCPHCGKKFGNSSQAAWRVFEFTEENWLDFRLILGKALSMRMAWEAGYSNYKLCERNGIDLSQVPLDVAIQMEQSGDVGLISLHSIIEYFHSRKMRPEEATHIIKTESFSVIDNQRQFAAHVLPDTRRIINALRNTRALNDTGEYLEIEKEVYNFIYSGIDAYLDAERIKVNDLNTTIIGKAFLEKVSDLRVTKGKRPITF